MAYNEGDFGQPLSEYSNIRLHKGKFVSKSGNSETTMEIEGYYNEVMLILTKLRWKWTSWAVLNEIWRQKAKKMHIMPYNDGIASILPTDTPDQAIEKLKKNFNATAGPDDSLKATPKGKKLLYCGGPNQTQQVGSYVGSGGGSDTLVSFTPQMWVTPDVAAAFGSANAAGPGVLKEEILLHEMVHGMRQMKGTSQCAAVPDNPGMDTVEEFMAIVISNVYRSELALSGLRSDHWGFQPLSADQTTNDGFINKDKDAPTSNIKRLKQLKSEHPELCADLAKVQATFNPFKLI